MKSWHGCLLGLAVLVAAGCRANPHIAALERELRLQEDRIYQLEDCLDDAQHSLASCEAEKESLEKRLVDRDGQRGPDDWSGIPTFAPEPPKVDLPEDEFKSTPPESWKSRQPSGKAPPAPVAPSDTLQPPTAPEFSPPGQTDSLRPPAPAPGDSPDSPPPLWKPMQPDPTPPAEDGSASQIEEISLGDVVGGVPEGGGSAAGMTILIQPRDAQGHPVVAAAPVSVVLIDPALPGESGRVARWDFPADAVADHLGQGGTAKGIRLVLPWPNGKPRNDRLHLFVRLTAPDGRKLEADLPIEIDQLAETAPRALPDALPDAPPPRSLSSSGQPSPPPRIATRVVPAPRSTPAAPAGRQRPAWSPDRPQTILR
ncbi:MAG: hypothetical protein JW809_18805 [Pirellulales bacterium]|nr:hypothetical protein [Pirellulales bacterium]